MLKTVLGENPRHEAFIRGLNEYGVKEVFINEYRRLLIHLFSYLQLIKKDDAIHPLFHDAPLIIEEVLKIFEVQYNGNDEKALLEESTFHHFEKILKNVVKGKIFYEKRLNGRVLKNQLELFQVLFWLTGSRRLTAMKWKIKVSF